MVLVFLKHQIGISAVFTHVRYIYLINHPYQPPEGGGGGTLIFSYIRRLGPFFWGGGEILNFNILWGFQKNDFFFWCMKILWIFLGLIQHIIRLARKVQKYNDAS